MQASYSPASSMISTATIRTTNPKESKEKQNREKLLAGPGSEFSLANAEDFELDYYDYNVMNAGAAPGSYLGMDPAYLVWIPPIDEGDIMNEVDHLDEPHYEEILPRHRNIDPGSNTETPDDEVLPELPPLNQRYTRNNKNLAATLLQDSPTSPPLPSSKLEVFTNTNANKKLSNKLLSDDILGGDEIQLHDFSYKKFNNRPESTTTIGGSSNTSIASPPPQPPPLATTITQTTIPHCVKYNSNNKKCEDDEKETAVFKSPSDNKTEYSYELDDIQFADEGDDDDDDYYDDDLGEVDVMVVKKHQENDLKFKKNVTTGGQHMATIKGSGGNVKT